MTPCEEWEGQRYNHGYGRVYFGWAEGKKLEMLAHRLIYMQHHGHTDLHILHECDNPPCINMAHLRAGTDQDNTDDKMKRHRHSNGQANKTHCKWGHAFTDANTYAYLGWRQCKECTKRRGLSRRSK